MKGLSRYFFRGTVVLLPLGATLYIFYALFTAIDNFGQKVLSLWVADASIVTGIGFVLTAAAVVLVGYLSSHWLGASVIHVLDSWMLESPITKGIYGAIKETISAVSGKSTGFNKVVAVNFPELGYKRVGFMTQEDAAFIHDGKEQVVVYLPHSFQVSGNMFIVPKRNVELLDIPKETAIKMIMSAGLIRK